MKRKTFSGVESRRVGEVHDPCQTNETKRGILEEFHCQGQILCVCFHTGYVYVCDTCGSSFDFIFKWIFKALVSYDIYETLDMTYYLIYDEFDCSVDYTETREIIS